MYLTALDLGFSPSTVLVHSARGGPESEWTPYTRTVCTLRLSSCNRIETLDDTIVMNQEIRESRMKVETRWRVVINTVKVLCLAPDFVAIFTRTNSRRCTP